MKESEINLLKKAFSRAKNYFEYGAGRSTEYSLEAGNLESVISVESDSAFVDEYVRPSESIRGAEESGYLSFHIVDIGPTKRWGHPVDKQSRHLWPNYARAIFEYPEIDWDLILVDGRFRNACVAASLLSNPDAHVLVHDFWRRRRYHPMLKYCDEVESAEQLILLKRKKEIADAVLEKVLEDYQFRPTDKTARQEILQKLGIKY